MEYTGHYVRTFRIYNYVCTFLHFRTYYADLDRLNANASTQWGVEYSMVDDYELKRPVDAQQMLQLLERMKNNASLYDQYIRYNSVMHMSTGVDKSRTAQLCSIEFVDFDLYDQCMASSSGSESPQRNYVIVIVTALVVLLFRCV